MWFLNSETLDIIRKAESGAFTIDAEKQQEYLARMAGTDPDSPRLLTIAGNTAQIDVVGTITRSPNFMAFLFGGGNPTWSDIEAALAFAQNDDDIDRIVMNIESAGGQVDGMFDVIATMQKMTKPVEGIAHNTCASAAYVLGSACTTLRAANKATRVGSVGVKVSAKLDDSVIEIASSKAPNKAPDLKTAEGRKVVQEELNAYHELMVETIAQGRDVTTAHVDEKFGLGGMLLADEAKNRQMIDGIMGEKPDLNVVKTAKSGNKLEAKNMNLKDLESQHPEVFAEAVQVGVEQERTRVTAHITMGKTVGDMTITLDAIEKGRDFDAAVQAEYMSAGLNRKDLNNREDDDKSTKAAADLGDDQEVNQAELHAQAVTQALGENLGFDLEPQV